MTSDPTSFGLYDESNIHNFAFGQALHHSARLAVDGGPGRCQAQWVAFLVRHETSFPGISSAARPLVATLVFGLYEITSSLRVPDGWHFDPFDAVSLAGWLVQRMCNARAVMLHSGEQEMKRRKHQGILDKLGEGPLSARDLGRRFHRMTTVECRGLLHELGRMGQVIELPGDRWKLTTEAIHHETQALVLSV